MSEKWKFEITVHNRETGETLLNWRSAVAFEGRRAMSKGSGSDAR